jgi:hypothetical protein
MKLIYFSHTWGFVCLLLLFIIIRVLVLCVSRRQSGGVNFFEKLVIMVVCKRTLLPF